MHAAIPSFTMRSLFHSMNERRRAQDALWFAAGQYAKAKNEYIKAQPDPVVSRKQMDTFAALLHFPKDPYLREVFIQTHPLDTRRVLRHAAVVEEHLEEFPRKDWRDERYKR